MTAVVLDNSNLDAIVADSRNEPAPEAPKEPETPVVEAAKEPAKEVKETPDDDIEGEDGLTAQQKVELTKKMQAAIGKKHRALKEAEEFAEEQYNNLRMERQRAEKLERELEQLRGKAQAPAEEAGEPKPQDFATEAEYQAAMIDWRVDQKLKAKEAEAAAQREAERQAQIKADASARIAKALEIVPDFEEVTEAADMIVPPHIAGYMQESELIAELGYHFAKNPAELERISKLSPVHALVALGKIESKLEPFSPSEKVTNGATPRPEPTAPQPRPQTDERPSKPRAAAPIQPLNSGSALQVEKPEAEMTAKEAMAAWQKRKGINLSHRQRH